MDLVQRVEQVSPTPFIHLLLAVFDSILEVFLLCTAGYILARQGILDKKTQKQINRLNVSLFTPALLFSKVAFFLTPEKLKELWVIPIWFITVTTASMAVGRVLGWLFGLRQSQRSFVMAAAMFMNSNALPIALMQSLVISVPDLAWGSDDSKNAMVGRALTYLTMYSTLGMVVRYSYGVSLLSRADTLLAPASPPSPKSPRQRALISAATAVSAVGDTDNERTPLLGASSSRPSSPLPFRADEALRTHASASTLVHTSSPLNHSRSSSRASSTKLVGSPGTMQYTRPLPELDVNRISPGIMRPPSKRKNTSFYNSFPNSPNESRAALPEWEEEDEESLSTSCSCSEEDDDDDRVTVRRTVTPCQGPSSSSSLPDLESGPPATLPRRRHCPHHRHQHQQKTRQHRRRSHLLSTPIRFFQRLLTTIHNFMTVPLWSALLSLVVACVQPLKLGLETHARPLLESVGTAGKCAVPMTLVVLGAYFYVPPPEVIEGQGTGKTRVVDINSDTKKESRTLVQRLKGVFNSDTASLDPASIPSTTTQKATPHPGESKTVALAVVARMIITPMLLLPLMIVSTRSDWHDVFEDPVFVTVNTILLCSPPALTLAQITAAVSGDAFERLISRTIFWSYCVMTPPVTIGCVMLGLWLAKL